jgi:hypothetical protein
MIQPYNRQILQKLVQSRLPLVVLVAMSTKASSALSTKFPQNNNKFQPLVSAIPVSFAGTPSFEWCITSTVNSNGDISIQPFTVNVDNDQQVLPIRSIQDRTFDLTQSGDWMEYLEIKEGRSNDEGGAGAYDTLRCDVLLSPQPINAAATTTAGFSRSKVWGELFHFHRLRNSYSSLVQEAQKRSTAGCRYTDSGVDEEALDMALLESHAILQRLLSEVEKSVETSPQQTKIKNPLDPDALIRLVRLTLLWSPQKSNMRGSKIVVRGHACSTCKPLKIHAFPAPIVVTVAAHAGSQPGKEETAVTVDETLPTRSQNPQSKVASWCRLRRKMETPETYKPKGVSEVLMVRPRRDPEGNERLELLEGLSSNLFVIYRDGTLRTATEGVLNGYARNLVLESAAECGLPFDASPIFLHQAHEWQEAFITSSSRLVWPISQMLIPKEKEEQHDGKDDIVAVEHDDGISFTEFWRSKEDPQVTPKWQVLLNLLLKKEGYDLNLPN